MATLINLKIDLGGLLGSIQESIDKIKNPEYLLRPAAENAIVLIHKRIHVDGLASDGALISAQGYSKGYMVIRTGIFQNSSRISRGVNKGKTKNSGTFTEATIRLNKKTGVFSGEDKVGKARPNFHRTDNTKVIISLTRQLEGDYAPAPTDKGYGVSFKNRHNYDKSQWVEATYGKPIFPLTTGEEKICVDIIQDLGRKAFT